MYVCMALLLYLHACSRLNRLLTLYTPTDEIEKREAERRLADERKHQEEIQFLKRTNAQLKVRTSVA